MRHQVHGFKLNRNSGTRNALKRNLATEFFKHDAITTTITKAKFIQPVIEHSLSIAKKGTLQARRQLQKVLTEETTIYRLMNEVAPALTTRVSGFTRIIPLKIRRGDNTKIVRLEMLPFEPVKATVVTTEQKSEEKNATSKAAKVVSKTTETKTKVTSKKSKE